MSEPVTQPKRRMSLKRALFSPSLIKPPPLEYAVRGPALCPGRIYTLGNRSDAVRADFFAISGVAAALGRPDLIGWENQPGRVVIVAAPARIDGFRERVKLVAKAYGVRLRDLNERVVIATSANAPETFALSLEKNAPGSGPFALICVDQFDTLASAPRRSWSRFLPLARIKGHPAVVVGLRQFHGMHCALKLEEIKP